ncbi:hypothetical protein QBC39DRAFT_264234 [Podospora conica]|nr:hypothetical protein QBC39DRAFT_264234 [Schizothecium conicum]
MNPNQSRCSLASEEDASSALELKEANSVEDEGPRHPRPPPPGPKNILDLPVELQFKILGHLSFDNVVRLGRTCKQYQALTSPAQLNALFGVDRIRDEMLARCNVCLERIPNRKKLLRSSACDRLYPFHRTCIKCAIIINHPSLRVGRKVKLGDDTFAYICHWCGLPKQGAAWCTGMLSGRQLHRRCQLKFRAVMNSWVALDVIRFWFGIVTAVICWTDFRHEPLVFVPAVTSFVLLWLCIFHPAFIPLYRHCYFIQVFLELALLGSWIPPVYYMIAVHPSVEDADPHATRAPLVLVFLNLLFRFVIVLGYVAIISGYDPVLQKRQKRRLSPWRKLTRPVMLGLIICTNPLSVGNSATPMDEEAPFTFRRD